MWRDGPGEPGEADAVALTLGNFCYARQPVAGWVFRLLSHPWLVGSPAPHEQTCSVWPTRWVARATVILEMGAPLLGQTTPHASLPRDPRLPAGPQTICDRHHHHHRAALCALMAKLRFYFQYSPIQSAGSCPGLAGC